MQGLSPSYARSTKENLVNSSTSYFHEFARKIASEQQMSERSSELSLRSAARGICICFVSKPSLSLSLSRIEFASCPIQNRRDKDDDALSCRFFSISHQFYLDFRSNCRSIGLIHKSRTVASIDHFSSSNNSSYRSCCIDLFGLQRSWFNSESGI